MDKQQTRGYFLLTILIVVVALFVTSLLRSGSQEAKNHVTPQATPPPAGVVQPEKPQPQERNTEQVWEGVM